MTSWDSLNVHVAGTKGKVQHVHLLNPFCGMLDYAQGFLIAPYCCRLEKADK
jgi:hypothetical protein